MLIDKARIRSLIPHAGAMCLLDAVTAWDEDSIVCVSATHQDTAHPLRYQERLAAVHAFEYGAQAVAIHGALLATAVGLMAPPAYLAAVRNAHLHVSSLHDIAGLLEVTAKKLAGSEGNFIYAIGVRGEQRVLAEARVTIMARPGGLL